MRSRTRARAAASAAVSAGSIPIDPDPRSSSGGSIAGSAARQAAQRRRRARCRRRPRAALFLAAEEGGDLQVVGVIGGALDGCRLAHGSSDLAALTSSGRAVGASGTPASLSCVRWRSSSSRKSRGARAAGSAGAVEPACAELRTTCRRPSKPVAMTVIMTSSPSRSLKLVPKMMFASGSAADADLLRRLGDLEQRQVRAARDVEQDPLGAADVDLEERARDRLAGGLDGAVLARWRGRSP